MHPGDKSIQRDRARRKMEAKHVEHKQASNSSWTPPVWGAGAKSLSLRTAEVVMAKVGRGAILIFPIFKCTFLFDLSIGCLCFFAATGEGGGDIDGGLGYRQGYIS